MTTAVSVQGNTVRIDTESALATADNGLDKDIRLADNPTLPMSSRMLADQPNIGHENPSDGSDKPIPYEAGIESGLTLPIHIRRGATTSMPPLMYFLQSGGWTITDSVADTVTAPGVAVDDFDVDASIMGAADKYGAAVLVETATGVYEPTLLASYDDAPDKTCKPTMDLPAIAAAGGDVIRMRTATVNPAPVGADETLNVTGDSRGDTTICSGCALADLGEIAIGRDGAVVLSPTFHVADVSLAASALDAATFLEGDGTSAAVSHIQRQETSNFKVQIGAFLPGGGITNATIEIESATIRPNITTVPIPGIGSSSCVNGWQGYQQVVAFPEVDITLLKDLDYLTDASKGIESVDANQNTYIAFIWGTTDLDVPAYGIWLPCCYQYAPPDIERFGGHSQLTTLHFRAQSPKFTGSTTTPGSAGMSPIYIAIHSQD
jgi:hypothetical protein